MLAVEAKWLEDVEYLSSHVADINGGMHHIDQTVLMLATENGWLDGVRCLSVMVLTSMLEIGVVTQHLITHLTNFKWASI